MNLDVKFQENTSVINAELQENEKIIADLSETVGDYGYDVGYETGYGNGYNEGYETGKSSVIDESKIIKKTASEKDILLVDDVSEVKHDLAVKLSSDTISDFSNVRVSRYGKNLFALTQIKTNAYSRVKNLTLYENGFSFEHEFQNTTKSVLYNIYFPAGTYYIKGECSQSDGLKAGWGILDEEKGAYIVNNSSLGTINGSFTITEAKTYSVRLFGNYASPVDTVSSFSNIQIEVGTSATGYEPFIEPITVNANADGTVKGLTHISPSITLLTDSEEVNISADYQISWGMYQEWSRFWDNLQQNGNRTNYTQAFSTAGWTEKNFKPKYDIVPTGYMINLFDSADIKGDLVELLENIGVVIDTKNVTRFNYAFRNSKFTRIGVIDMSNIEGVSGTQEAFSSWDLETIDEITASKILPAFSSSFNNCTSLKNIKFTAQIGGNIQFNKSPLSVDSMKNIISKLVNYAGTDNELINTIKFTNECWEALEADSTAPDGNSWKAYVTALGWLV